MNLPPELSAGLVLMAKEYADTLVKGSLAELGGMFSDTLGQWRLRNKVPLMLRPERCWNSGR